MRKPEGQSTLGRPKRRWDDNIKTDLHKIGELSIDWTDLIQYRHNLWAAVDAVKNILLLYKTGNFLKS